MLHHLLGSKGQEDEVVWVNAAGETGSPFDLQVVRRSQGQLVATEYIEVRTKGSLPETLMSGQNKKRNRRESGSGSGSCTFLTYVVSWA